MRLERAELPEDRELSGLLAWLDEFSRRWDPGADDESILAGRSIDAVSDKIATAAFSALGLVKGGVKPAGRYDHVLLLGDSAATAVAHPLHLAKLVDRKKNPIETSSAIAIAVAGEMTASERDLVAEVTGQEVEGGSGLDRLRALEAGIRHAFGLDSGIKGQVADVGAWSARDYGGGMGLRLRVATTTLAGGLSRSTSAELLERFSPELVRLRPGERILVVAPEVQAPVRHAEALCLLGLPCKVEVETVAVRASDVDPRLPGQPNRGTHLQEVRSTIVALRRLLAAGS